MIQSDITILICGKADARRRLIRLFAGKESVWKIEEAADSSDVLNVSEPFDCAIFCDDSSPADRFEVLQNFCEQAIFENIPVIVVSRVELIESAVALMRAGAADVLLEKDLTAEKLTSAIENAITRTEAARQEKIISQALRESDDRLLNIAAQVGRLFTYEYYPRRGDIIRHHSCNEVLGLEENLAHDTIENVLARIHPEDRALLLGTIENLTPQSNNYRINYRVVRTDGEIVTLEESARAFFDEKGEITKIVGVTADVTGRKKTENILSRYRLISERARDIVLLMRPDGDVIEANEAAIKSYGYQREEFLQKNLRDLRAPETLRSLDEQLERANREGILLETFHQRQDGSQFPVEVSSGGTDINGERFLLSIIRDITVRKRTETALRQSEEFSRSVLESSPDCVKILDTAGRIEFMNENGACLLELDSFETIKNQSWQNFWSGDEQTQAARTIDLALSGAPARFQGFCPTMTGKPKWWDVIVVPVQDADGKTIKLLSVSRDITEQKRAQDALLKAERRAADDYEKLLGRIVPLAEVIGTARELAPIYRAIGEFVRATMPCIGFFVSFYEAATRLRVAAYAWSEGNELDVSNLPKIFLSKTGAGPNSRAIRTGKTVLIERQYMEQIKDRPHYVIGSDGKNPSSSIVVPMIVMGRIIGTIEVQAHEDRAYTREHIVALEMAANLAAVAIENVRLIESETALRHEAEAVNRAKDEFLAVLSHELRTPLNAMLGWATLLKKNQITGEEARHAVDVIERNVRVQNTLIEDLLDVSRIITGKMRIEPEKIDFNQTVEIAIETALPVAEKKNIRIEKDFALSASEINGDPHRLQQVVGNLLSNAVKFTPEDGTICVEVSHVGDKVKLSVSDSGIGIESDLLPQIFDRFSQADSSTKRKYGGLGLGLAIVRSLVEMHGGRVFATSDGEGKGSRFTVELPLVAPEPPPLLADPLRQLTSEADAAINGGSQSKLLEGLRVLVVDDDRFALEMLQFVLKNHGAQVTAAASGKEALEKFSDAQQHAAPDLLISDIGMAGMDGFDLIAEIRARQTDEKPLPAAALTAYAAPEDRARALAAGFQIHIPKPIDIAQLPLTIARLAGRNQN